MSDIVGRGFGDSHNWKRTFTRQADPGYTLPPHIKVSDYVCQDCGAIFHHHYDIVPDIFQAMSIQNVREVCPGAIA